MPASTASMCLRRLSLCVHSVPSIHATSRFIWLFQGLSRRDYTMPLVPVTWLTRQGFDLGFELGAFVLKSGEFIALLLEDGGRRARDKIACQQRRAACDLRLGVGKLSVKPRSLRVQVDHLCQRQVYPHPTHHQGQGSVGVWSQSGRDVQAVGVQARE